MIVFVGTPNFLSITLQVAMATMHFYIAKTSLFCSDFGGPREQFGTGEKLSWGAK